jgi:thymidine phosphorylase
VVMHAKPGDRVREGDDLLTLHTDEPHRFERALAALDGGVVVSGPGTRFDAQPLVLERVAT